MVQSCSKHYRAKGVGCDEGRWGVLGAPSASGLSPKASLGPSSSASSQKLLSADWNLAEENMVIFEDNI